MEKSWAKRCLVWVIQMDIYIYIYTIYTYSYMCEYTYGLRLMCFFFGNLCVFFVSVCFFFSCVFL